MNDPKSALGIFKVRLGRFLFPWSPSGFPASDLCSMGWLGPLFPWSLGPCFSVQQHRHPIRRKRLTRHLCRTTAHRCLPIFAARESLRQRLRKLRQVRVLPAHHETRHWSAIRPRHSHIGQTSLPRHAWVAQNRHSAHANQSRQPAPPPVEALNCSTARE